jgi:hypothetical protein
LDFVNSGQMDPRITFSRASGATWFNSAGTLIGVDASSSSLTVGTGQQTLTLAATAGVDRGWIVGTSVLLSASTVTNTMTGVVVSYTASTQVLVVNVASVVGSGTYATWQVSNLMPRLDFNPSTLAAQGLLIEESRTNSIRNNTMVGAVAGTPGTLPTNWAVSGLGTLTQQVVGTGTSNGVTYIDVRFSGTTSTTQTTVRLEANNVIAAANGQTWTQSSWTAMVGGSTSNITQIGLSTLLWDSGGSFLGSIPFPSGFVANTTSSLIRVTPSGTIATVGTAFAQPQIYLTFASGVAIDVTLRIGLPQLEQGAFATSVIPTTTTALTRAADVASVNTLSPWYNATEGTLYAQGILVGGTAATFPRQAALVGSNVNDDTIDILWNAPSGVISCGVRTGGATQMSQGSAPAKSAGSTFKAAVAYKTNDANNASDGNVGTTDTTVTLPTVQSLRIGGQAVFQPTASSWIQRIAYYPTRLSNAQLQAITA